MSEPARDSKQIGNAIRRNRKKRGWSQSELREKVGVRQGTISLLEGGHSNTRIGTLLAVLAALDLELQIVPRSKSDDWKVEDYF